MVEMVSVGWSLQVYGAGTAALEVFDWVTY
jgi:hypothetical protein